MDALNCYSQATYDKD